MSELCTNLVSSVVTHFSEAKINSAITFSLHTDLGTTIDLSSAALRLSELLKPSASVILIAALCRL